MTPGGRNRQVSRVASSDQVADEVIGEAAEDNFPALPIEDEVVSMYFDGVDRRVIRVDHLPPANFLIEDEQSGDVLAEREVLNDVALAHAVELHERERVVARATGHGVIAGAAGEIIVAGAAGELVISLAAVEAVVAGPTDDGVVASPPCDEVVTRSACHCV